MTSQKTTRDKKKLDCPCSGCAGPDPAHSVGSPGLGFGELPLFSRTGFGSPRGKLDAELGKVRLHSETLAVLQVRAAEHGMSLSEFVRIALECLAFGTDNASTLAADRIRRVGALMGGIAPQQER